VDTDPSGYQALSIREAHRGLMIPPSMVRADSSLYEVAEAGIRNPGARVISVVDGDEQLVGLIPVAAIIEHLLVELAAPELRHSLPDVVLGHVYARHLGAHQAKDIMYQPVTVGLNGTVRDALRLMQRNRLDGLPITDERGRVVGYADQLELLSVMIPAIRSRGRGGG
jgi:CBS domain-containing protein